MPRTCSICRHPQRHEIEDDLRARLPYRDVARRYGVSKDTASRHRRHVSLHTTLALATATKIMALRDSAVTANTWNITLLKIQETRHWMEDLMMLLSLQLKADQKTTSDC